MRIAPIIAITAVMMGTLVPIGAAEEIGKDWRAYARTGDQLPELVKEALKYAPAEARLRAEQVVVVDDLKKFLPGVLAELGYPASALAETQQALDGLAEFTLDQRFPIFVVPLQVC